MLNLHIPLLTMLRLLGQECGDRDVALAAFDLLDPETRKELISQLTKEPEPKFYEIQANDVGRTNIFAWHQKWGVSDLMDKIQVQDVGKWITRTRDDADVEWILHVENTRQRDDRLEKARHRVSQEAEES